MDLVKWATRAGIHDLSQKPKGLTEQNSGKKTSRTMFCKVWRNMNYVIWKVSASQLLIHLTSIADKANCERSNFRIQFKPECMPGVAAVCSSFPLAFEWLEHGEENAKNVTHVKNVEYPEIPGVCRSGVRIRLYYKGGSLIARKAMASRLEWSLEIIMKL